MKKRIKALIRTHKAVKTLEQDLLHVMHLNDRKDSLYEAKKLHADIYKSINFVDDSDIIDGLISEQSDPHQTHSFYFGVYDKSSDKLLAIARQIEYNKNKGYSSFPVISTTRISSQFTQLIKSVEPSKVVEISALVKAKGAGSDAILYLLREMLLYSIKEGHEYWLMALDTNYNKSLKAIFGNSYKQIGDVTAYKGGDVIPCIMSPKKAINEFKQKSTLKNIKTLGAHSRVGSFFADIYSDKDNNK